MRNQTIATLALIGAALAAPVSAQRAGMAPHGGFQGAMPGRPAPSMPAPAAPQQPHWNGGGGQQGWSGGGRPGWNGNGGPGGNGGQHWNGGGQQGWNGGGRPGWNGNGGRHWNGNGGGVRPGGWNGRPGGGSHWGGRINGRWSGGWNAPGGWNAYRRPSRGWRLPSYWFTPNFYISDYGLYGLAPPPYGYSWTRYYDDAVLVDGSGRVRDYVGGLDWDQYDSGYDSGGYDDGYQGDGGYGASYPAPPAGPDYGAPGYVSGGSGVTTYSIGGGYSANGYYYPPATTTTVTIQQAPSVTTTTTEYVETVKTRYVARKAWKPKRKWHPKPRINCLCGS
ncbi:RcnB family protein [Sphingomonas panacis]|nr:RcnB family protein [Sphingomonas panacis]